MDNEIVYRSYKKGDENKIVKLLEDVFTKWPDRDIPCSSVDFWKWKYLDSPYNFNTIAVAELNNRIIGCYHAQHYYTLFNGETYLTRLGTDVATHPDFRGMGLFNKMLDIHNELEKNLDARLNIAVHVNPILIDRVKRKISEMNDRIIFDRIYEASLIDSISLHLNNTSDSDYIKKYIGFYVLKTITKLSNLYDSRNNSKEKIKFILTSKFDDKINQLLKKEYASLEFGVIKNEKYLNWRYCDKRAGNYIIKNIYYKDELIGYYVLKINKIKEYYTGNIVDFFVSRNHYDLYNYIIKDILKEFKSSNVNVVRQWIIKNSITEKILNKNGFIDTKSGIPVLVIRKLMPEINLDLLFNIDPSHINFHMGDTEWM